LLLLSERTKFVKNTTIEITIVFADKNDASKIFHYLTLDSI